MLTTIIVVLTSVSSYLAFNNNSLKDKLVFYPYAIKRLGDYYRFISSGLIHADWMHLIFNMYVLYMFGNIVEQYYRVLFGEWANLLFFLLYVGGIVMAEMYSYFKHQDNSYYRSLGASGAVSGVIMCYILFEPWHELYFIFFPFMPIPAIVLGVLYMIYSYWAASNSNDNIGHNAHFWGGIFGIVYTLVIKPEIALTFFNKLTNPPF